MINSYKKQYKQFNNHLCFSCYKKCSEHEYSEAMLSLVKPKIISNLTNTILPLNKSLVDLNNNLLDIKSSSVTVNTTNKFDKKNKNTIYSEDILDIKKKKNKLQKKHRKQIVLEEENLLRHNSSNVIFNDENLNTDIIKVHKTNKNKKKEQNKIKIDENIQKPAEQKDTLLHDFENKEVVINRPLTIQELSGKLYLPEAEIIKYLFLKGIPVTINQIIDIPIATEVALKYNFVIKENESKAYISAVKTDCKVDKSIHTLIQRPPIITVLGHVDHGKTTLLDSILNKNLVTKEIGGITQSIANYEIEFLYEKKAYKLIFLDTPGHQAFASTRIRGTSVTDLVLLVVAADDGLKPQTIESIKYILEQNLPYIVVINKIDKIGVNILKVREELAQYNIIDESWGGDSIIIEVSALKQQNLETLLNHICLLSDLQDLKADPKQPAAGTVIETYLDIQKGPMAVLVIQNGSLQIGDFIVSGDLYGKVKMIINNVGIKQEIATPSAIVKVLGFSSLPKAGDSFYVVSNKKAAEHAINNYQNNSSIEKLNNLNNRITLESIQTEGNLKKLNLILKTDSQGSSEAIINAFNSISQEKVQINILQLSCGNISHTDIELALTSDSVIVGFNISISNKASYLAKQLNVSMKTFNIIYDLIDYIITNMLNLVDPEYDQLMIGKAIVQTVFDINKGSVAGCMVIEGKLSKGSSLNIYRDSKIIHNSKLNSLKRMKDDVNEVTQSNECGIMCYDYHLWNVGDIVEAYELKEKEKVL